jgi:hypothetical protein
MHCLFKFKRNTQYICILYCPTTFISYISLFIYSPNDAFLQVIYKKKLHNIYVLFGLFKMLTLKKTQIVKIVLFISMKLLAIAIIYINYHIKKGSED